jgi:crossover junction endodeoxyribonuclease RusA
MIESSKEVGPWRERVALAAHNAMNGAAPIAGYPVLLELKFCMPRPASAPKTKTPPAIKRPDADKLARAVLDAMTNVVFGDDSQVVDLCITKRIAGPDEFPGVAITVFAPDWAVA